MDLETKTTPDPDIERAYEWLQSFLPPGEWDTRKSLIEEHLEVLFKPKASMAEANGFHRLVGTADRIGWYLYLVQTSQHEPYRTEVHQASRVLPIFKRIGADLDELLKIDGIAAQAAKLVAASGQPDSVLFEMLVALLWSKNGWSDVAFIPASPTEKRPDIRAASWNNEWFIETKRMATNSGYAQKERDKWLRMWKKLSPCLVKNNFPFILDITFHVELEAFNDDFLVDQLESKLKFVTAPCDLITNPTWDVSVRFVDFEKIKAHLEKQYVKSHSRQLQELVGGSWDRNKGFTFIMSASVVRLGGDRGINQYVDELDWAAGAYWHCDADRANEAKARDIRSHLSDAVNQLPANVHSVIHVGLETPDGEQVEAERYARILNTVGWFDAKGKDLRWVYTHLYESYAPPDKAWYFDETIYKFGLNQDVNSEPIAMHSTVVPPEVGGISGVHWMRDAP